MAANFSPFKGSYVLNQFLRNVMFGMNGFHVSSSGAIQGHHGPLVILLKFENITFWLKINDDVFFNSLPNNKLNRNKLKAFAEEYINVFQKLKFGLKRIENIEGKEENAGYHHLVLTCIFSFSHNDLYHS